MPMNISGPPWAVDIPLTAQQAAIAALVSGDEIPSVTYNGAGKVSGFTSDGVAHTITYPDANTITITNSLGASRTVAVNNAGRVVAAV